MEPTRFDAMRKGAWDPAARVHDMDINGIYASLNFPSAILSLVSVTTSRIRKPEYRSVNTNAFIGKLDQNLNPIFVTYAGTGGLSVTAIAATADAVYITGSIFGSTLPVTPSAIIQTPAAGSFQNGFVERFNATGTALLAGGGPVPDSPGPAAACAW